VQFRLHAKILARLPSCALVPLFVISRSSSLRLYWWCVRLFVGAGLGLGIFGSPGSRAEPRGLPFIRTYPFDEIGNVPRNLRLSFDAFGRIAVMYDGIFSVLNDTAWVDQIDGNLPTKSRMTTIRFANGKYYYGGRGSWGTIEFSPNGQFRAQPFVPENAPSWTSVAAFNQVMITSSGVFFYDVNGMVYWDFARRQNFFFALPRVAGVFKRGERVFVSCQDASLRELRLETATLELVEIAGLSGAVIDLGAALDPQHTLLATHDGRLLLFDGTRATSWSPQSQHGLEGRISALESLREGGVAIAINGKGVFLVSAEGAMRWSLSLPAFRRVGAMAANEPGVLWIAEENAIQRVYYDSPLTSFGQQLGLSAVWPKMASAHGRVVVSSNRNAYELVPSDTSSSSARFELLSGAPSGASDCVAVNETSLLIGAPSGVFAESDGGKFIEVASIENVAAIEFVARDTCLVIGSKEITALTYSNGRWSESAARTAGVGDAPIRTMTHGAVWIEMGADRIGRVTYDHGVVRFEHIPVPWHEDHWTNLGAVGDLVVLSGSNGERAFYDDARAQFCEASALDKLLRRSPYWIARVTSDASGVLWGTYTQGVVTFTPEGGDYRLDAETYELRNDSYPDVYQAPGDSVWITTGRSLYHVEPRSTRGAGPRRAVPVSLVADNLKLELLPQTGVATLPSKLALDDNSLSFRLFSGTYAWRYPPLYEYRLNSSEPWTKFDSNLLLHFPKLRDGSYRLEVRSAGHSDSAPSFALDFVVNPPWFRTPLSYTMYALFALASIAGIVRWTNHQSLKRNAELQRLVHERTRQLEDAMEKLGEETRSATILAERSRLAGELHDSLQQGLSGSILQLDSTLDHTATIPGDVRSRLNTVRKMLSYTREEVQQAVWNLESPLLQNSDLSEALKKLASLINTGSIAMNVDVPTEPVALEPTIRQNLLRIAQEAITNAVKHAGASRINVVLRAAAESIALSIIDDGAGFDPVIGRKINGHFGLRGIHARAKSLKANLQIESSPGQGTCVKVTVPLPSASSHDSRRQTQST